MSRLSLLPRHLSASGNLGDSGNFTCTFRGTFLDFGLHIAPRVVAALTSCSSSKKGSDWWFTLIGDESRFAASVVDSRACTGVGVVGPVEVGLIVNSLLMDRNCRWMAVG